MDRTDIDKMTLTEKATAALNDAVARVFEQHRREGRPVVVWRDGKAVYEMPPEKELANEAGGAYHAEQKFKDSNTDAPND